jgi:phosphoserine phosphatase
MATTATAISPAPRPLKLPPALLVTDFDSTVTLKDTLTSLVSLSAQPERFDEASRYYTARFTEVEEFIAAGRLENALTRSEEVENSAIDLVIRERMLSGISAAAIREASKATLLRPGAMDALRAAAASGVGVHVCSANWSPAWISGALLELGDTISVHTNELEMDVHGLCTGGLSRAIVGPADKARCFARLREQSDAARTEGRACVFVGDALPDLTAMLDADVGILIGENHLMRAALAILSESAPLRELEHAVGPDGTLHAGLYVASSWDDIARILQLHRLAVASRANPL